MALDGKRLVNYLAHGIPQIQIATVMGVSESRVSQLATDPRIIEAVGKRKKELAEAPVTELADLGTIRRTLITRMKDLADTTDSLSEAVNTLEKIDKITARATGREDEHNGVKQVIMQAPIFIQMNTNGNQDVELDAKNRIIAIKGRSMAQMPTKGVLNVLNGESNVI